MFEDSTFDKWREAAAAVRPSFQFVVKARGLWWGCACACVRMCPAHMPVPRPCACAPPMCLCPAQPPPLHALQANKLFTHSKRLVVDEVFTANWSQFWVRAAVRGRAGGRARRGRLGPTAHCPPCACRGAASGWGRIWARCSSSSRCARGGEKSRWATWSLPLSHPLPSPPPSPRRQTLGPPPRRAGTRFPTSTSCARWVG